MYRAFELTLEENILLEERSEVFVEKGKELVLSEKEDMDALLWEVLEDGTINGSELSERYFPTLRKDVFLSYSHDDQDLAYMVAGMLHSHFNLNTFVDSYFWGSADELLKRLDDQYCWQKNSGTYNYRKRNFSTSHVHAMLTAAIMKAMDSSEIIIFLNTPNSVPDLKKAIDQDKYDEYTLSPWIYEEMLLTTMLRETGWELYRREWRLDEGAALEHYAEKLTVKYKLPKEKLIPLSLGDIDAWYSEYKSRQQRRRASGCPAQDGHPLNVLYEMKCGIE